MRPKNEFVSRYFKSHSLLVEQRLEKDKLPEVVRESDVALRYLQKIKWSKCLKLLRNVFTPAKRRIN